MKTVYKIFKNQTDLLEEPAVKELADCYEAICDDFIDLEQSVAKSKEKPLKVLIKEIQESISSIKKHNKEAERFGYNDKLDYEEAVHNLERYIQKYLEDHSIYL